MIQYSLLYFDCSNFMARTYRGLRTKVVLMFEVIPTLFSLAKIQPNFMDN
jgi:hypothetical protein